MNKQRYTQGDTVGDWTILEFKGRIKQNNKNTSYLCRCSCGFIKPVLTCNLTSGSSKRCKKCTHKKLMTRKHIMDQLWNVLNHGAKRRSIPVEITKDDMLEQFNKQNQLCALTGIKLEIYLERDLYTSTTASLDRIDNTKGYLKDNIQWVHKKINALKNDFEQSEFLNWCKLITDYKSQSLI